MRRVLTAAYAAACAAALAAPKFAAPGTIEHNLAAWVVAEGGFVGDVAAEVRGGVRGLYVTRDVAAGTLLLSVPEACIIAADEDPQWGLSLRELATCRLVGHKHRGEHLSYTAALPAAEPLLCDWTDRELDELQSPRLSDVARGMLPFLDESVARILPFVPYATEEDVRWAERMVRSRALIFGAGFGMGPMMGLIPIVDLANHRAPAAASEPVVLDVSARAAALVAPRDLAAGDEITICYRDEGNEKLLLDYGFAVADRPSRESLHVDGFVLDSPVADRRALDALGVAELQTRLEAAAAPTTLEEDRAALADPESCPGGVEETRWRHALAYRVGQKALLADALRALESADPISALAGVRTG